MGWLAGWLYRKDILLGSSVDVTDYQFKILVGESSNVTGSDVNCEACLSSFNDIRFTDSDGTTLLNYWIEYVSGTTPLQIAAIWVKVPLISTSSHIYIYSGNASAPSVSNGENTFLFFDDAASSDLSSYTINTVNPNPGTGTITWTSNCYSVRADSTGHVYARINPLGAVKNIALHVDIFRETNVNNQQGGIAYCVSSASHYGMSRYVTTAADNLQLYHIDGGTTSIVTYRLPQTTWAKLMVGVYNNTAKSIWKQADYTLINDMTITLPTGASPGTWGLFSAYDTGAITRYKNIFARNYVLPEPGILEIDPLVTDFSAEPLSGYVALTVNFTDQSLGYPTGWEWDFGDGSTSTEQNPVHIYTVVGVYTVTLTTTKDGAPSDTLVKPDYISVNTIPIVADFSASSTDVPANTIIAFTDLSTSPVTLTAWEWDFGNGDTSTEQNPFYVYTQAGIYPVTLRAFSGTESDLSDPQDITVNMVADFSVSTTSGNAQLWVQFTDATLGTPTSWLWDFGDGETSTEQNPRHLYRESGLYTVTLTASRESGVGPYTDTEIKADLISVSTHAEFVGTPRVGYNTLTVQFSDLSTGSPISWYWSFGDGNYSTEINPIHTYNSPGIYSVQLTVSSAFNSDAEYKTGYIVVEGTATPDVAPEPDILLYMIGDVKSYKEPKGIKITFLRNNIS